MSKKLLKGFTLVELVVVLILMGLITTAITMVLRPTTSLYIDVNNKTNEEVAAITLFDVVNGELRYATNVYVVSNNDDTVIPSLPSGYNLKHYVMFSNKQREGDHLGAYGYIKHGLVSAGIDNATSVGSSDYLLGNTDVKFSITGYSALSGNESITLKALMHPMSSRGMLTDKEYKYEETFKFLNLQCKAQLSQIDWTKRMLAMGMYDTAAVELGIDSLLEEGNENNSNDGDQVFWIFYERPDEAVTGLSTSSVSASPEFKEFNTPPHTKTIDLGAESKMLRIHYEGGAQYIACVGGTNCKDGANPIGPSNYGISANKIYEVSFTGDTASDYVKITRDNGNIEVFRYTGAEMSAASGTVEKYIYVDDTGNVVVADEEYAPEGMLGDPVYQTVHFLVWPGAEGKGIRVTNVSGKKNAVSGDSMKLDANGSSYTDASGGSFDLMIGYYAEGASAQVELMKDSYNSMGSIGTFGVDSSHEDVWVASNGNIYYSEADALANIPIPSIAIDESAVTMSGEPNQYYGSLTYTIPIQNTSSVVCSSYSFSFSIAGPFNIGYSYCDVSGSNFNFSGGKCTVTVSGDTIAPGSTKIAKVYINGGTGQSTNNAADYLPTDITCKVS